MSLQMGWGGGYLSNEKTAFVDKSRVEPTIFFIERVSNEKTAFVDKSRVEPTMRVWMGGGLVFTIH